MLVAGNYKFTFCKLECCVVDKMEARQPATALLGLAHVCQRASAAAAYRISPRVAPTKRKRPARRSSILDGEVKDLWRLSRIKSECNLPWRELDADDGRLLVS